MTITDSHLESLKRYFRSKEGVAFAFLFGSQARGRAGKLSDIDIAAYFFPEHIKTGRRATSITGSNR